MKLSEYTEKRAKLLSKLNFSEIESPSGVKLLWFDVVTGAGYTHFHSHSFYEMHFVLRGSAVYVFEDRKMVVEAGTVLFVSPDIAHRYDFCSEDLLKISVAFSFEHNYFSKLSFCVFDFDEATVENLNYIFTLGDSNNMFLSTLVYGRVLETIVSAAQRKEIVFPEKCEKEPDARFIVASEFIQKNRHRIISCDEVAKECCISSKQLNRIFVRETENTLSDYITNARIRYAKKLLLESNHSIKEIGFLLGFETESGFLAFFKRRCNVPPGEFRKQRGSVFEKMSEK